MANTGPHPKRLLIAGFAAILAAGMGAFDFTIVQDGRIAGATLLGFCFGIIIGGLVADRIGYGRLITVAFGFHILSGLLTLAAGDDLAATIAFASLWTGAFLFAIANGVLQSALNPLVVTLFPNHRTHYLNILHAAWPAGMVIGAGIHYFLGGESWKLQFACFLLPTMVYGVLFFHQRFPRSEAASRGFKLRERLRALGIPGAAVTGFFIFLLVKDGLGPLLAGFAGHDDFFKGNNWFYISASLGGAVMLLFAGAARWTLGAPLLCGLFVTHALVGLMDPGVDGWIQDFESGILQPGDATNLFIYTSSLVVVLRFCAGFFQRKFKLTPPGLLLACSLLAATGLNLVSFAGGFWFALAALTVYALGQAFVWPTMLAVASDRFPRCGAVAISIMGGLGIMSASLIGSPGLGYACSRFSGEALAQMNPGVYAESKAATPGKWLAFREAYGIDARKLSAAASVISAMRTPPQQIISDASVQGDRKTLRVDSFVPLTMAGIFALLLLYFKVKGGYGVVHLSGGGGVGRRESIR